MRCGPGPGQGGKAGTGRGDRVLFNMQTAQVERLVSAQAYTVRGFAYGLLGSAQANTGLKHNTPANRPRKAGW